MDMNFPLGIGLNVQPECKLHCSAPIFIRRKKVRSDVRASFLGRRSGGDLALGASSARGCIPRRRGWPNHVEVPRKRRVVPAPDVALWAQIRHDVQRRPPNPGLEVGNIQDVQVSADPVTGIEIAKGHFPCVVVSRAQGKQHHDDEPELCIPCSADSCSWWPAFLPQED